MPFWASRKAPKKQRGINRTNQRSQNEGVSACEKGLTGLGKGLGRQCFWEQLGPQFTGLI